MPEQRPQQSAPRRQEGRVLRAAALVYAAAFAAHTADHLRRGTDAVTTEVLWAGNLAAVVALGAIALCLVGHRVAPVAAVAAGFPLAVGYAVVHLLPRWSDLSDSFPDGRVDGWSWAAAFLEIAGALLFGAAGAWVLRRRGLTAAAAPRRATVATRPG